MDIFQEYPDEVEYIFKPSCVPLMRCAGCCGDEGLECVPVDVYNVTMEVRVQLAICHACLEGSKSAITAAPANSEEVQPTPGNLSSDSGALCYTTQGCEMSCLCLFKAEESLFFGSCPNTVGRSMQRSISDGDISKFPKKILLGFLLYLNPTHSCCFEGS